MSPLKIRCCPLCSQLEGPTYQRTFPRRPFIQPARRRTKVETNQPLVTEEDVSMIGDCPHCVDAQGQNPKGNEADLIERWNQWCERKALERSKALFPQPEKTASQERWFTIMLNA